ncbi:hypothetical protein BT63DRAFT_461650 [Microthyrium microscopicum]|uniref:Uncharacterized protein n=1 Tax=Microthyrium microscopicum TaxID=703497 RepID=A0A6A6TSQ7_9PEZI|nr:hypothetical protein BT63DRAFT_461650 [Microthyrium microscopicum]
MAGLIKLIGVRKRSQTRLSSRKRRIWSLDTDTFMLRKYTLISRHLASCYINLGLWYPSNLTHTSSFGLTTIWVHTTLIAFLIG